MGDAGLINPAHISSSPTTTTPTPLAAHPSGIRLGSWLMGCRRIPLWCGIKTYQDRTRWCRRYCKPDSEDGGWRALPIMEAFGSVFVTVHV